MEPHGLEAACQLLRQHSAHNNFHLAWHEFRDLNRPFDWELLRGLGQRVALVAAPRDMWFPEHHLQELREAAPNVQVGAGCLAVSTSAALPALLGAMQLLTSMALLYPLGSQGGPLPCMHCGMGMPGLQGCVLHIGKQCCSKASSLPGLPVPVVDVGIAMLLLLCRPCCPVCCRWCGGRT
jgi:hypothetical protein